MIESGDSVLCIKEFDLYINQRFTKGEYYKIHAVIDKRGKDDHYIRCNNNGIHVVDKKGEIEYHIQCNNKTYFYGFEGEELFEYFEKRFSPADRFDAAMRCV